LIVKFVNWLLKQYLSNFFKSISNNSINKSSHSKSKTSNQNLNTNPNNGNKLNINIARVRETTDPNSNTQNNFSNSNNIINNYATFGLDPKKKSNSTSFLKQNKSRSKSMNKSLSSKFRETSDNYNNIYDDNGMTI